MKNKLTIALGLTALVWSSSAFADRTYRTSRAPAYSQSAESYRVARTGPRTEYDFAQVLAVEPIVRYVTVNVPRRECWDEDVVVERERRRRGGGGSAGATIAGGLLGGVLGRQIGGGSGRDAMTLVGAVVGSAIGSQSTRTERNRDDVRYDTVQRCETVNEVREEQRIDGYNVTYLYNGREYTTRTRNDPGDRLRVRVTVNPANRR